MIFPVSIIIGPTIVLRHFFPRPRHFSSLHKFSIVKYENMMIKWCIAMNAFSVCTFGLFANKCSRFTVFVFVYCVYWVLGSKRKICNKMCVLCVHSHFTCSIRILLQIWKYVLCKNEPTFGIRHRHDIKIHLINEVNHFISSRFVFLWFSKWTNVSGIWPILLFCFSFLGKSQRIKLKLCLKKVSSAAALMYNFIGWRWNGYELLGFRSPSRL